MSLFRHALLSAGAAAIACAMASLAAGAQPGAASPAEAPPAVVAQASPAAKSGPTPSAAAQRVAHAPEAAPLPRARPAMSRAVRSVRRPPGRAVPRRLVRPSPYRVQPIRVAGLQRPVVYAGGNERGRCAFGCGPVLFLGVGF